MSRFLLLSRYAFLPLIALLGVALLVGGYFEWRRFYAELYLEETAAIEAAVAAGLEVEYRRAGEPRARIALRRTDWGGRPVETAWDRERSTVPDNAPFLGRVESVVLRSPRYAAAAPPTKEVRDGLLRLPGRKGLETFEDSTLSKVDPFAPGGERTDAAADSRLALEQALGQGLPDLPSQELTVEDAATPLPRGRALDSAERETLIAEIAEAWQRPSGIKNYVARSSWKPGEDYDLELAILEVADGARFASGLYETTSSGTEPQRSFWGSEPPFEFLRLVDGDNAFVLDRVDDRWARVATFAGANAGRAKRFAPYLFAPRSVPGLVADSQRFASHFLTLDPKDPLGPSGENVAAIERIDDDRLRIELLPTVDAQFELSVRFEMIVRQDLNFAVERSLATMGWPARAEEPTSRAEAFVNRRLERIDDAVYASEMLRVERSLEKAAPSGIEKKGYERVERLLTTVVAASDLPGSAFDPRTYDPTPWPEPRALPVVRGYWVLWSVGGGLVAIGLVGPLFTRRRSLRRRVAANESGASDAPVRRSPRLRFGLATLFAAALGMISVAGATKQIRDEAMRDVDRVARLEGAQYERREPRFPWSLFSTLALPIDAPLKRIVVAGMPDGDSKSVATPWTKELLASPDLDSFVDESGEYDGLSTDDVLGEATKALNRRLPELPGPMPELKIALWLQEFPDGEAMEQPERSAFVAKLARAWTELRKKAPRSYLIVEEDRVTLRDGERWWTLRHGDSALSTATCDGDYLYRYCLRKEGASLIERTRRGASPMMWAEFPDVELYRTAMPMPALIEAEGEAPILTDRPGSFPDPPYAFPQYLYFDIDGFESVAQTALDPQRIVRVARLDETRVRVDFAGVEVDMPDQARRKELSETEKFLREANRRDDGAGNGAQEPGVVEVSDLSIVVREDLDYAAERSYVVTTERLRFADGGRDVHVDLYGAKPPKRKSYLTNRLVRTAEGLVVPDAARVGVDPGGGRTWWDRRFAYDFAPELDERIFASPSMAQLQPIPEAVRRRTVTWPWVTGALSLALFAGVGARRVMGTIQGRRASKGEEAA